MRNLRKRKKVVIKVASKGKNSNQTIFAKNLKTLVQFDHKKIHTEGASISVNVDYP